MLLEYWLSIRLEKHWPRRIALLSLSELSLAAVLQFSLEKERKIGNRESLHTGDKTAVIISFASSSSLLPTSH